LINISKSELFTDKNHNNSYFGTKRFDRKKNNQKIHTHSLANLIHADFRIPSLDYEILIKVCSALTKNYLDLIETFKIMVFNIFAHNRDDHGKNFSYLMDETGKWSLSPAYDLTFCYGPGGEHSTTVAGEGKHPTIKDIKKIGDLAGIPEKEQQIIIEKVRDSINSWKEKALDIGIDKKEVLSIEKYHNLVYN